MSDSQDMIRISATRQPYRRAGLDLRAPVTLDAATLSEVQMATLQADPVVHIADAGDDVAIEGEVIAPAANAKELIEQIGQVQDEQSLDAIGDGETRKTVLAAIDARRAAIRGDAE